LKSNLTVNKLLGKKLLVSYSYFSFKKSNLLYFDYSYKFKVTSFLVTSETAQHSSRGCNTTCHTNPKRVSLVAES